MSSITMAADSTQSELKDSLKGKRHKKSSTKKKKKTTATRSRRDENDSNSDCDSDMDLTRELKPIGGYLDDRQLTIEHMFRSISGKKLKAMLPEILKPIPVNELKKLCIEQLECMSKKRISRILEGADPETISSTGTEEDSSLSDDDKHPDGSTDHDLNSDNVTSDHKNEESHIPVTTAPIDNSASPQSCVSRSRLQSGSSSASRSESPGCQSDNSVASSLQSSKNADVSDSESHRYTEAESSTEEIVEEVVYEEVVLEDGDDLESILGHGSFLKGTKDARLKTVTAHRDDPGDKDNEIMMIEREEREEQPQVINVKDSCQGRLATSENDNIMEVVQSTDADGRQTVGGRSAARDKSNIEADSQTPVTSSLVTSHRDVIEDNISCDLETGNGSKISVPYITGSSITDDGKQHSKELASKDNMEDFEDGARAELEEGEIEDSSSEHEELIDEQPENELVVEKINDDQIMRNVSKRVPPKVMVEKVKVKTGGKKKKVRVIKRIIKVIRKKPRLESQSNSTINRDVPKKLKVSHQTRHRQDAGIPDNYLNVRIKTEPGLEQSTSAGMSPRSSNPSKSISRSSVHAKIKMEPSAAAAAAVATTTTETAVEQGILPSVSEKSLNQMEILELEMRARAIKAMLKNKRRETKAQNPS